jgi:hypothetical protein
MVVDHGAAGCAARNGHIEFHADGPTPSLPAEALQRFLLAPIPRSTDLSAERGPRKSRQRSSVISGSCAGTRRVGASPVVSGTIAGGGEVAEGSSTTVTATPKNEFHFVHWTEGGHPVSTASSYTFIMPSGPGRSGCV